MAKIRRETDLCDPIRVYLMANGYTVRSEVHGCDMTAVKDDELVVIELKRGLTIDLLVQATIRQRMTDSVYVAVPVSVGLSRTERRGKRWKGIEQLLKRLELGLILVDFPDDTDAPPTVEVAFHPVKEYRPRKRNRARRAVLQEIAARSADYNLGGTAGRRIMTAYREEAVQIACLLQIHGQTSPAKLVKLGAPKRTADILARNYYHWFERLERGIYTVRPAAIKEIETVYGNVVAAWREKCEEREQHK